MYKPHLPMMQVMLDVYKRQVFAIMSGTATEDQVESICRSADKYLYDQKAGGYRLNTNFHEMCIRDRCKIKEGTQSGSRIRLRGKGIVSMKDANVHGCLLYTSRCV